MSRLTSPTGKDIVLPAVRPNAGVRAAYQKALDQLIADMQASLVYWISAAYRGNPPPDLAEDARPPRKRRKGTPAKVIQKTLDALVKRWTDNFEAKAQEMAQKFVAKGAAVTDTAMNDGFARSGFTVKFSPTPGQKNAMQAAVAENVTLIKSVAQQHLTQVQGSVMRSVAAGRDLSSLVKDLEANYGVTRRRAKLIALDQNNKATATLTRVRRAELGITEAIWQHSSAGKVPRPSHVKMNGQRFNAAEGMYDPDEGRKVQPGELIRCRCTSRSIIPALGRD